MMCYSGCGYEVAFTEGAGDAAAVQAAVEMLGNVCKLYCVQVHCRTLWLKPYFTASRFASDSNPRLHAVHH